MITSQDIKMLEEESGVSRAVLMENAGKAVYNAIKEKFGLENKRVLVVCYHGNNGGDGFVAANHLCDEAETDILFIGDEKRMKKETLANYKKIERNDKIQFLIDDEVDFDAYDIIVDAILGIGIKGRLNKEISAIIDDINGSKAAKVSVDIPTGIDPDTGETVDKYINADLIVTFHDMKQGLDQFKERVVVADIGL
ncbi:MAG: NAD(P)H-hydrate epimerase [Nanoarchaeota archaeon]